MPQWLRPYPLALLQGIGVRNSKPPGMLNELKIETRIRRCHWQNRACSPAHPHSLEMLGFKRRGLVMLAAAMGCFVRVGAAT